jgi:hypothetical protein
MFVRISKTHISNYHFFGWFFHENFLFFDVSEILVTNNYLILISPQKTKMDGSLIIKFLMNWNVGYLKIQMTTKHWFLFSFSNKMVSIKILPNLYVR